MTFDSGANHFAAPSFGLYLIWFICRSTCCWNLAGIGLGYCNNASRTLTVYSVCCCCRRQTWLSPLNVSVAYAFSVAASRVAHCAVVPAVRWRRGTHWSCSLIDSWKDGGGVQGIFFVNINFKQRHEVYIYICMCMYV